MNSESIIAIIRIVVPAACGVLGVLGYSVDADSWLNVALVLTGAAMSIYSACSERAEGAQRREVRGQAREGVAHGHDSQLRARRDPDHHRYG